MFPNEVNDFLQTTLALVFISSTAWYLIQFFTGNPQKIKELIIMQLVFAGGILLFKQLFDNMSLGSEQVFECQAVTSHVSYKDEEAHKIWNCQGFPIYFEAGKTVIEYIFSLNILKNIDQKGIIVGLIMYNLLWGFIQSVRLTTTNILKTLFSSFVCLFLLTGGSHIVESILNIFSDIGGTNQYQNAAQIKALNYNIFTIDKDVSSYLQIWLQPSLIFMKIVSALFISILFLSDILNTIFILVIEIAISYLPIFGIVAMLMGNFRYQTIFMVLGIAVFFGATSIIGLACLAKGNIPSYGSLVEAIAGSDNKPATVFLVTTQLTASGALFIVATLLTFFLAFILSTKSLLRNILGR